jgi:hypothetical protein
LAFAGLSRDVWDAREYNTNAYLLACITTINIKIHPEILTVLSRLFTLLATGKQCPILVEITKLHVYTPKYSPGFPENPCRLDE